MRRVAPRERRAPLSSRVLPIPGSPTSSIAAARALIELGEDPIERTELLGAPDEVLGKHAHAASLCRRGKSYRSRRAVIGGSARSSQSFLRMCSAPVTAQFRVVRIEKSGCEIRRPARCQRRRAAAHSTHVPLPPPAPPPAARVRRRVRVVQGAREPAPPPSDARLVPLRRARDLVDGRSRERGGGAAAAAVLRRRANDRDRASARWRSHDRP